MPSLDFKGKSFVYAHHLTVPFRELTVDAKKSFVGRGEKPTLDGNLIIHGDNLHALKALLPIYAGKVDCIYIDPPYNTGKEGWCYNDNVRSPLMKEWLKKSGNPVEKDDLERHDKWLCMMWPRIQLLKELLSQDGVIFVSIDDNEVHRLRALMDEVFEENFAAQITVLCNPKGRGLSEGFADTHEYVLVFTNRHNESDFSAAKSAEQIKKDYTLKDKDGFLYRELELRNTHREFGKHNRKNMWFPFYVEPKTSKLSLIEKPGWKEILPRWDDNYEGCWTWNRVKALKDFDLLVAYEVKGRWKVYRQDYAKGARRKATTVWTFPDVQSEKGQDIFSEIMGQRFPHPPKAVGLIERLLEIGTDQDSIVLDSFAGSGTTAHAVLALNKKDGGNRKFILVETEDYADKLTAERMRRVMGGYEFEGTRRVELLRESLSWARLSKITDLIEKAESIEKFEGSRFDKVVKSIENEALVVIGETKVTEKAEGLGGSFTFCTLGDEMNLEGLLTGKALPSFDALAKYVFYTATGKALEEISKQTKDGDGFIGETDHCRLHLLYKPDKKWLSSADAAFAEPLVECIVKANSAKKRVLVFAAVKYLSQKELSRHGIEFCQLPYAIHRILGE